jgi:hypothetical protein
MTLETKCQNIAHRRFSEARVYGNRPLETCPFCRIEELESSIKTLLDVCEAKDAELRSQKEVFSACEALRLKLLAQEEQRVGFAKLRRKWEELCDSKDVEIAALEKRIEELDAALAKLRHCSLCRFFSVKGCQMPTKKGSAPGAHCPAQKLKGTKGE